MPAMVHAANHCARVPSPTKPSRAFVSRIVARLCASGEQLRACFEPDQTKRASNRPAYVAHLRA